MNDTPILALATHRAARPGTLVGPAQASRRRYGLTTLRSLVATWRWRKRFRRELEQMSKASPHLIDDIGLTRRQVEAEIAKPLLARIRRMLQIETFKRSLLRRDFGHNAGRGWPAASAFSRWRHTGRSRGLHEGYPKRGVDADGAPARMPPGFQSSDPTPQAARSDRQGSRLPAAMRWPHPTAAPRPIMTEKFHLHVDGHSFDRADGQPGSLGDALRAAFKVAHVLREQNGPHAPFMIRITEDGKSAPVATLAHSNAPTPAMDISTTRASS